MVSMIIPVKNTFPECLFFCVEADAWEILMFILLSHKSKNTGVNFNLMNGNRYTKLFT